MGKGRCELSVPCRSPAIGDASAQQVYFQGGWGCSPRQADSSESSPSWAILASAEQHWASSTEHLKNKTTEPLTVAQRWHAMEVQLHFVQLDHWGHLGSQLGSWNNCKYPAVWRRYWKGPSVVGAWEQRGLYGTFNNHTREDLHGITLPHQGWWEGSFLPHGVDDGNMSGTCLPLLPGLKINSRTSTLPRVTNWIAQ